MSKQIAHKEYLLVDLEEWIGHPHIDGNQIGDAWADEEFMPYETLPDGKWAIVGKASELSEEQAGEIVEVLKSHNMKAETTLVIRKN